MAIKMMQQKELTVALASIARNAGELRQAIQGVAIQAIILSISHGEKGVNVANALMDAVSGTKALRRDSLVAYMEKFGNLGWLKGDKKFAFFQQPDLPLGKVTAEHEALVVAKSWDDAKREADITSTYDMEAEIRKFIARMHKITGDKANKVEKGEALAVVEQTFVRWSAETTLKSMKADQSVLEAGEQADEIAARKAAAAA
jgi:hypothetical protein